MKVDWKFPSRFSTTREFSNNNNNETSWLFLPHHALQKYLFISAKQRKQQH